MTKYTTNRGYAKPEPGEKKWHEPVNKNWDDIDSDIHDLRLKITDDGDGGEQTEVTSDVITAATAAEIQPAIDELAADRDENGARGGVVQLEAKTYYPETTIWLKSGVTLQGARQTRPAGSRRIPHVGGGTEDEPIQSTVISTAEMNEGADAYSHEHDRANPHPHLPVISNYQAPPVINGEPNDFDETTEEYDEWGADIGVRNIVITADKKRWWDYDEHGTDGVYNSSRNVDDVDMSDRDWATYFGVYDALLFESTSGVIVENVRTNGFLGYGALFKDVDAALDRGSSYHGGATDYHGNALALDHSKETHSWTRGTWDVDVQGPTPALKLNSYTQSDFVSGGWSEATIQGQEQTFLGDEADFQSGDAPLVSVNGGESTVHYKSANSTIDGYTILAPGRGGDTERTIDGIRLDDDDAIIHNCEIQHARSGIVTNKGNPHRIQNCRLFRCKRGISCTGVQPVVNDTEIESCEYAVKLNGRSNRAGTFSNVTMRGVGTFVEKGNYNNDQVIFNHPDFLDVDTFGEEWDTLVINNPAGYESVENFPERHKPS